MHKELANGWLIAILSVACVWPATGRPVNLLGFQEMFAKADLVAIARPSAVRDVAEHTDLPNISPRIPVSGVETEFEVAVVFKGDRGVKRLSLHHFREVDPKTYRNAPWLVSFDPSRTNSFLVFLTRESDGRFAAVNGQTDPGLCAIIPADGIDLIAQARPISEKHRADEKSEPGTRPPVHLIGYETEFETREIIKGEKTIKHFALHHYERTSVAEKSATSARSDRLDFDPKPDQLYLLFLNKERDGRFAPMIRPGFPNSQTSPRGFSIVRLWQLPTSGAFGSQEEGQQTGGDEPPPRAAVSEPAGQFGR